MRLKKNIYIVGNNGKYSVMYLRIYELVIVFFGPDGRLQSATKQTYKKQTLASILSHTKHNIKSRSL